MRKNEKIKTRNPLQPCSKELLLAALLRIPKLFVKHKDDLHVEHFGTTDHGYRLVWQIVLDYHRRHGKLPDAQALMNEVAAAVAKEPTVLTETERLEVEAFIDETFNSCWPHSPPDPEIYAKRVPKIIRKLREEAIMNNAMNAIRVQGPGAIDLPALLDAMKQDVDAVANVDSGDIELAISKDWYKSGGLHMFSTGVPFLDAFLGGGQAPKEVYGVMGPYGSCKTMMGVMLAVESARHASALLAQSGDDECVVFVSYEAPREELTLRILSYAARIRRNSLETMNGQISALSTAKRLRPYERRMFREALAAGVTVQGERERAAGLRKWINKHLIVVDMTGSDKKNPGAGNGFISEISTRIAHEMARRGIKKCRQIIVDYVGAMAKRHLAAMNKDESDLRHLITDAGLQARNQLAMKFNCPVWLFHQLSGEANSKQPGARFHYTDAAESGSFAENVDFCFIIGPQNRQQLCRLINSKHRRTAGHPDIILKIDGAMNRVGQADDYAFDPQSRRILDQETINSVTCSKTCVPSV